MSRHTSCEMCAVKPPHLESKSPVAQIGAAKDLTLLNVNEPQRIPHPCKITILSNVTATDCSNDFRPPLAPQHLTYGVEAEVLLYHIQSQADTSFLLKFNGVEDMTTTLQHLHMGDLLTHDDEGVEENGPYDIDYLRMLPG